MNDDRSQLTMMAALEWIAENTTLEVDASDPEAYSSLPACAKLFVQKFGELMNQKAGVSSQSIEGLSLSFDTANRTALIWELANSLLGRYMRSQVTVTPAKRKWN